ncbi:hypothetical protein SCLCIDRAFT_518724 [Scleroderma citrinum Foug A]|uniref:Uncharacterized protein n=1 Tax=Scleroderma citrinum Foug A TaxID=1036808 RepID=A0A0C3EQ40_9AGAM|nr:hypothetical protein SCLCIDRAFT_518724 [Scleroderma citrinum Foug A]
MRLCHTVIYLVLGTKTSHQVEFQGGVYTSRAHLGTNQWRNDQIITNWEHALDGGVWELTKHARQQTSEKWRRSPYCYSTPTASWSRLSARSCWTCCLQGHPTPVAHCRLRR